jgi:hypothetical protein
MAKSAVSFMGIITVAEILKSAACSQIVKKPNGSLFSVRTALCQAF